MRPSNYNRILDAVASLLPHQPDASLHLPRTIVIRFASRADAEAWYHSPVHMSRKLIRGASISFMDDAPFALDE